MYFIVSYPHGRSGCNPHDTSGKTGVTVKDIRAKKKTSVFGILDDVCSQDAQYRGNPLIIQGETLHNTQGSPIIPIIHVF